MERLIKDLGDNYELTDSKIKNDIIIISLQSISKDLVCPYCDQITSKIHSHYVREIQDLPIMDKQTILMVNCRKMYCKNPKCDHKIFSEQLLFANRSSKKTNRLLDKILKTSSELSSVGASKLLKQTNIKAGKSMLCEMLKKNATHCG